MNPFNGNKDPDLPPDFVRKWEDSQVFIYYKQPHKRKSAKEFISEYSYPDCFGNLITADYVITATSCFIDLKKFVERIRDRENVRFHSDRSIFLKGEPMNNIVKTVMKSDISKITIAKVLQLMLTTH